jgi:hypothetical protein
MALKTSENHSSKGIWMGLTSAHLKWAHLQWPSDKNERDHYQSLSVTLFNELHRRTKFLLPPWVIPRCSSASSPSHPIRPGVVVLRQSIFGAEEGLQLRSHGRERRIPSQGRIDGFTDFTLGDDAEHHRNVALQSCLGRMSRRTNKNLRKCGFP